MLGIPLTAQVSVQAQAPFHLRLASFQALSHNLRRKRGRSHITTTPPHHHHLHQATDTTIINLEVLPHHPPLAIHHHITAPLQAQALTARTNSC